MPLNIPSQNSIYGNTFKVRGQVVVAFTPIVGEIWLDVPWSKSHIPSESELADISRRSMAIADYCQKEGFFNPGSCQLTIYLRCDQKTL